jgi:hypothetical protein
VHSMIPQNYRASSSTHRSHEMVQPEELVRMAAKADSQAAIEPTINLSDDTGDKRTELGDLNPWTDTPKPGQ